MEHPGAAMATKHLGFQIDISCGGVDNLCRHHDYTIAVVEAVFGKKYARYWLHGGHLLVDGKKMSKSRGNIVYLDNLLDRGYSPEDIRFYLTYGHYREKMNLTEEKLQGSSKKLNDFRQMVEKLTNAKLDVTESDETVEGLVDSLTRRFEKHMNDDLDVKGVFDTLFETLHKLGHLNSKGRLSHDDAHRIVEDLKRIDKVLQVIFSTDR